MIETPFGVQSEEREFTRDSFHSWNLLVFGLPLLFLLGKGRHSQGHRAIQVRESFAEGMMWKIM
jgi:hypothetical protein